MLFGSSVIGRIDGSLHGISNLVGIHQHPAIQVSCSTPGSLGQRALRPEETLLVGVQDGHQRYFRKVQPLPKQVDTHQHIETAFPKLLHDLHPLHRIHIRVDVTAFDANPVKIPGELFCHSFGQGGNQDAFVLVNSKMNFMDQIVDLVVCGAYFDNRIEQSGWTDDLLHDYPFTLLQLIICWSGTDKDQLFGNGFKFIKFQWSVVRGSRQPETIVDKGRFPRTVATVHRTDLRHRHVALVDDHQKIIREKIEKTEGAGTRSPAIEITGIIFDSRTISQFTDHLQVVIDTVLDSLCFGEFSRTAKEINLADQIILNLTNGRLGAILRGNENIGRIDGIMLVRLKKGPVFRIEGRNLLHFIPKELNSHRIIRVSGENIDRISLHPEIASLKIRIRS